MLTFANPLGLIALLGIPAILAIHFLQRKAIQLPVSTLFLLEMTRRDAASGRRFERIIPSVPLWMQLLSVIVLTWMLAEPRFQKQGSIQRIAVVLDGSASMRAFKKDAISRLVAEIPGLQGAASSLELSVIESSTNAPKIYSGSSVDDMQDALETWQPTGGTLDPTSTLRLARSMVSQEGAVVYLTDTPVDRLPFAAQIISVGEVIENVGITGVRFSEDGGTLIWKVLVRNHGQKLAERTWVLRTENGATAPRSIRIEPGKLLTIQGAFPKDQKYVRLELSPDQFDFDDTLPMVAPRPKDLSLYTATSPVYQDLTSKLIKALEAATSTDSLEQADLSILSYDPLDPTLHPGNAIVFVEDSTQSGAYLKGGILTENHPLMERLNWQSLLVRESLGLDILPGDTILLSQGKRPLIFLREVPATAEMPAYRRLCFNFDLRLSNAGSQPAFIVLLHRFAENVRNSKVAPVNAILETGEPISVSHKGNIPLKFSASGIDGSPYSESPSTSRAPERPGFLSVKQGDTTLLDAAVYFADSREADFSKCAPMTASLESGAASVRLHTVQDPYWRYWIILLLAALIVAWQFTGQKTKEATA